MAVMNEIAEKAAKLFVKQRPILWEKKLLVSHGRWGGGERYMAYHMVAVNNTINSTNGLLLNVSPNGHKNNNPTAYPA